MSVEFHRGSPGKFDPRTLNRETLSRWTGRTGPDPGQGKELPCSSTQGLYYYHMLVSLVVAASSISMSMIAVTV